MPQACLNPREDKINLYSFFDGQKAYSYKATTGKE